MDFVFTESFYTVYEAISDAEADLVDEAVRRLLRDHATGWARQGRIEGDKGGAWIVALGSGSVDLSLYWDYHDDVTLVLLALVIRR
ncbi:MAG TPA: hypothetical protein VM848_18060 [Acidimicrobiia bacterium]|nr:hypothetical protein [Acidimicrobiia bacterium]